MYNIININNIIYEIMLKILLIKVEAFLCDWYLIGKSIPYKS